MDKDTVFTPEDYFLSSAWASLVAQMVKNPPSMGETWLQSLIWEDPTGHAAIKPCPTTTELELRNNRNQQNENLRIAT